MKKPELKVGDRVKVAVSDFGKCYSSFDSFAKTNNLSKWKKCTPRVMNADLYGTIIAIAPHNMHPERTLCGIRQDDGKMDWIFELKAAQFQSRDGKCYLEQTILQAVQMMRE